MTTSAQRHEICLAGDSADGIHDQLFAAITTAREQDRVTWLTGSQGEEIAAIIPPASATTAELLTVAGMAAAQDARDRVIAILRHALCYDVHTGRTARLVRDRNSHLDRAYATGQALKAVLRELGDPGDRALPRPDGELPLNPAAEDAAREYLGPAAADHLLGKRPVQ